MTTQQIRPFQQVGLDPESVWGKNLIKNSPGQIPVDGAEPQWWDDVANATITDEDTAGEAPSGKHERLFKVVTTANDVYGYQTLAFADEELLVAGETIVSLAVWVWCASASKASVGIYGTNLGLEESAQHTGGSGWELLKVEDITLDGGDASIEVRLIVDTGTAYFAMPMLCVGGIALPWKPRGMKHVPTWATQFDITVGDTAWSDTDCTANTDPLAVAIQGTYKMREPDGAAGSFAYLGHENDLVGGTDTIVMAASQVILNQWEYRATAFVRCSDSQVIRYYVAEQDADNDVNLVLFISGYWMWE